MTASAPATSPGLRVAQFHRIAEAGFFDPSNAYPHAMCWFRDRLYVGTTRCVLQLLYNRFDPLKAWPVFPVKPARDVFRDLDLRAQIWRYDPGAGTWAQALVSPMTKNSDGIDIPCFQGIRNMFVYRAETDEAPCLYALTWSPQKGPGTLMLRSEDGEHFDMIPMAGALARQFSTFRPMVELGGRLFTAPTGRTGAANQAGVALVMETRNPRAQMWTQSNPDNFGDPHNETVFEMAVFDNHLYAGTLNPDGFQLWKTDARGDPPYRWTCVLKRGADRGPLNQGVGSLCEFNGALYIGTVINNGGYDRRHGIGPAPVEIIRVHPDDSWDLVMGDGRITESGIKSPASGFGSGFDKFFNSYLWRMCAHDGHLYAGTFSWSALLPYIPRDKWPESVKNLLDRERTDFLVNRVGGCDLWRTRDGNTWLPVTQNGFGNIYNWGVRTMAATPRGLFVGLANPFGPLVAVPRNGTWTYEPNPRGGCEIWLGSPDAPPPSNFVAAPRAIEPPVFVPSIQEDRQGFFRALAEEFFEYTGHGAIGCWTSRIRSAAAACDNLVDEVVALLPEPAGRILDYDCGSGATTRRLLRVYPADAVTGVCLDRSSPRARDEDTVGITWADRAEPASADAVITLETLSRRKDGLARLRDAVAALKPGGRIVGAQVLSAHPDSPWRFKRGLSRRPVLDPPAFAELLRELGLEDVRVDDRTSSCWTIFRSQLGVFLWGKRLAGVLDEALQEEFECFLFGAYEPVHAYVLFHGRKP